MTDTEEKEIMPPYFGRDKPPDSLRRSKCQTYVVASRGRGRLFVWGAGQTFAQFPMQTQLSFAADPPSTRLCSTLVRACQFFLFRCLFPAASCVFLILPS